VVAAHGATDSGLCWARTVRAFESGGLVFAMPDARGHGASDKPADGYDYEHFADDLAGLIEALRVERPVLMGHSMGAATVAYVAARRPELARALVLEDPPFGSRRRWSAARRRRLAEMQVREIARRQAPSREALIELGRNELHPGWHQEDLEPWADAKQAVDPAVVELFARPGPEPEEMLPQVRCPVLLVMGEPRLGGIVDEGMTDRCRGLLRGPGASLEVARIRDAGHQIHRERFEPFVEAVGAFLSGLAGSRCR
jgi:pimeloyl-ACP methyl ester carboxylesterase